MSQLIHFVLPVTCSACHSGLPEPGASPSESRLRFPTEEACVTCHAGSVHAGVAEHVGETMDPTAAPGLAWMEGGRIACWTCHEVHEPGSAHDTPGDRSAAFRALALREDWTELAADGVTWPGTSEPQHPPLLALSADEGDLCRACHGEGP